MNPELLRSFRAFVSRTSVLWMCASLAVTFATSLEAAGEPLSPYVAGPTFDTALDPREPVIADFNRDGTPDFAVVCATGFVSVFLGTGNGAFGSRADFSALIQRNPAESDLSTSLEVADMNNDGIDDLITANLNSFVLPPGSVSVLLGNGDGTFRPSQQFPVSDGPIFARAADMNGDGYIDVVATNSRSNTVSVLLGNGDGTLQSARDFPTGGYPRKLAIGDFNEDGFPDVLVTDYDTYTCSLLMGNGDGTLQPRIFLAAAAGDVVVGRLNGDSHLDLVACTSGFNTAQVFVGSGNGTFTSAGSLNLAMNSFDLKLADLNLDGTQDVVALGQQGDNPQTVSIFLNHGDATFEPRSEFTIRREPTGMAVGRLDSDQLPDIVIADRRTNTVSLWQTTPSSADRPPFVTAPTVVYGTEGQRMTIDVTASDPDGNPITSLSATQLPPGAAFTTNADRTSGTLDWTPDFAQAGVYTVVFNATNTLTDITVTSIFIANQNGPPVADAGGTYSGIAGTPVYFNGSASFDPDGDPLTFAWHFGDGAAGSGATPMHTYKTGGAFNVSLRVTDPGGLHGDATTTATITGQISVALVLKKGKVTLNLDSDDFSKFAIEESELPYANILVNTLRLSTDFPSAGTVAECAADPKQARLGDLDKNGVADLEVRFSDSCLRNLLRNVANNTTVNLIIAGQAQTTTGMTPLRGVLVVTIKRGSNTPALAMVSPNPFNPRAKLSFVTMEPGEASVQLFDLNGRLVRTLVPQQYLSPGVHEVTIDGLDDRGLRLSSGVYFFRVQSADGVSKGALTVLK